MDDDDDELTGGLHQLFDPFVAIEHAAALAAAAAAAAADVVEAAGCA